MKNVLTGDAVVCQGGGPTAVINQSLVGIILKARKYTHINTIYGSLNGIEGIVNDKLINLNKVTQSRLEKVAKTVSSALQSTRIKPDETYCKQLVEKCKEKDIKYIFYIGGNDTSDTLRIADEYAKHINYPLIAVHVPKTIDNDLVINDHCPGYGSAARFVSEAFVGCDLDNKSLSGIYIAIVMGRHAGFLTAASALGRQNEDDGPHLIYLPEVPFSMKDFVDDVIRCYKKYNRCVVAVSEGIQDKKGVLIAEKYNITNEKDPHGHVILSNSSINDILVSEVKKAVPDARVRGDKFGYIQRSYPDSISEVDSKEARKVGEYAVHFAVDNQTSGSVVILREKDDKYLVRFEYAKLADIAGKTKTMPRSFINKNGNNVTVAFFDYALPLIGKSTTKREYLV